MKKWYFKKDGQVNGPHDAAHMKKLARTGKLLPTDLIRCDGRTSWVDASKAKGLEFIAASEVPSQPIGVFLGPVKDWWVSKGWPWGKKCFEKLFSSRRRILATVSLTVLFIVIGCVALMGDKKRSHSEAPQQLVTFEASRDTSPSAYSPSDDPPVTSTGFDSMTSDQRVAAALLLLMAAQQSGGQSQYGSGTPYVRPSGYSSSTPVYPQRRPTRQTCYQCNGSGHDGIRCTQCGGSGLGDEYLGRRPACQHCRGKGFYPCYKCGGSGYVMR